MKVVRYHLKRQNVKRARANRLVLKCSRENGAKFVFEMTHSVFYYCWIAGLAVVISGFLCILFPPRSSRWLRSQCPSGMAKLPWNLTKHDMGMMTCSNPECCYFKTCSVKLSAPLPSPSLPPFIHPSIFNYCFYCTLACRGWSLSQLSRSKGGVKPLDKPTVHQWVDI